MESFPAFVWVVVLGGLAGLVGTTAVVLRRGALAVGLPDRTAIGVAAGAAAAWVAWVALNVVLATAGVYRQDPVAVRPWIVVALATAVIGALLATRVPAVARILDHPDAAAGLVLPQAFRVIGGVFLVVMAMGQLPAVFALPAGIGDVLVGLSAPFVARRLRDGTAGRGGLWFTALGILDLVVAVGIGFLAGLGPTRLLVVSPATEAVGVLPLVLIPTAAVPLALALHIVALPRVLRAARQPV